MDGCVAGRVQSTQAAQAAQAAKAAADDAAFLAALNARVSRCSGPFELVKQPKAKQRKSYANENRYVAPNPLAVRHKDGARAVGHVRVELADADGRPLGAAASDAALAGTTRVPLRADVPQTDFQLKMLATNGCGPPARPPRCSVSRAVRACAALPLASGDLVRLVFHVAYRIVGGAIAATTDDSASTGSADLDRLFDEDSGSSPQQSRADSAAPAAAPGADLDQIYKATTKPDRSGLLYCHVRVRRAAPRHVLLDAHALERCRL